MECGKCGEPIQRGEEILLLVRAEARDDGDYKWRETQAIVHSCCDDGLSLTMDADAGTWLGDPESACEHMKRKFDIP